MLKEIKRGLQAMGNGLAEQHRSESVFTLPRMRLVASYRPSGAFSEGRAPFHTARYDWSQDNLAAHRENLEAAGALGRKNILVIGQEKGFSSRLIRHAIGMARRNECGLLALNIAPVNEYRFATMSNTAQERIVDAAELSSEPFFSQARENGIPFLHMACIGKVEAAILEMHEAFKPIHFILTEVQRNGTTGEQEASIPVFCLNRI